MYGTPFLTFQLTREQCLIFLPVWLMVVQLNPSGNLSQGNRIIYIQNFTWDDMFGLRVCKPRGREILTFNYSIFHKIWQPMSASLNYYLINENTSYAHSHREALSFYFYHNQLSSQTFQPTNVKFEIMGEDISTGGLPIANLWFHQSVYEKEFEWSRIQGFAPTSVDPG